MTQNIINVKTAIVGAGISGIAASINLLKNNYFDFIHLEVNDRIGGRINTQYYDGDVIEYGAQYMHGQIDNPVFYFSRDNKLISEDDCEILNENNLLNIQFYKDSTNYYATENGERLSSELVDRANECFDKVILKAKQASTNYSPQDQDVTLGDFLYDNYFKLSFEEFKKELESNESEKIKILIDSLFNWRCKCECSINGCASIYDLSLKYYTTYKDLGGNLSVVPIKGYKSVIDKFISYHESEFYSKLRLNSLIKRINLCNKLKNNSQSECEHCSYTNDSSKIILLVNDLKNNSELIIICDNVLLTMSLGYLKTNITDIIHPKEYLPTEKLTSIKRLGFGTCNKLFLIFDKEYWDKNLDSTWLLKEYKDKNFVNRLKTPKAYETDWTEDIIDFDIIDGNLPGLMCWINQNEYYEKLDDETVVNGCIELLKKYLGRNDIPKPIKIFRSKWQTNKYYNGSYSFMAFGAEPTDFKTISEPISFNNKNMILFAGEHTHDCYFSTVHGAYLSGIRESERILKA